MSGYRIEPPKPIKPAEPTYEAGYELAHRRSFRDFLRVSFLRGRREILAGPKYALYSVPDFGECRWTLATDNLFGKAHRAREAAARP